MTKKIKSLSMLTVAVLAGLFVTFSALDIQAAQIQTINDVADITVTENVGVSTIAVADVLEEGKCGEGKCGEGKCGGATKEAKKETKREGSVKAEKEGAKVASPEGKCGEGKCGGAEKKEGKAEKKESKKAEGAEGKCGEGKCGVA